MFGLLSKLLSTISTLGASSASTACFHIFLDEPEMPRSLIKK